MIDFHTHILPGIDDGSKDPAESLAMLREERRQGVEGIVATPHFYADRHTVEEFLKRRENSVQRLKEALAQEKEAAIPMCYGAEVYFFFGMGRAEKLPQLCLQGTNLLLVEMPFFQWDKMVMQELEEILTKQKLRVVLAHVERYPEFQKDERVWNQIMDMAHSGQITIQLNGGAFLRNRSKRKFALRMLESNRHVILGSDCHNMSSRAPNLEEARKLIGKKLGQQRVDMLDWAAKDLLAG